jgi:hypothetical protein
MAGTYLDIYSKEQLALEPQLHVLIIASANAEVDTSVAPSICRAKS